MFLILLNTGSTQSENVLGLIRVPKRVFGELNSKRGLFESRLTLIYD